MVESSAAPSTAIIHQATIEAPAALGEGIAQALEQGLDPAPVAVGLFDRGAGRCEVFAHYAEPPRHDALLTLIGEAGGGDSVGALRIEQIVPEDWVTLSQGQRGKVVAGRFLVHGSHDRTRVPRSLHHIEIDAGHAFGTAHHATRAAACSRSTIISSGGGQSTVIDIGTGTGILAIAAAKVANVTAIASDNDPVAVTAAHDKPG